MFEYLVRAPFRTNTPNGPREWNMGEAIRLSSSKATHHVASGYLVERNVGLNHLSTFETRVELLMNKLDYSRERAEVDASVMVSAQLRRHEALKRITPPSEEFLNEVAEFNKTATGKNPISKEQSDKGVGEWAGYRCNIGTGCPHGCLYCYAENFATRFKRVEDAESWRREQRREASTADCRKYPEPIMFPTSHDITEGYLKPYRCHLLNILSAGNEVVIVSKPHEESIQAICAEFSSFRDNITFRLTIGSLENETFRVWEPGAPELIERLKCLRLAFCEGFMTSISAEPMLGNRKEMEKLYYLVEPYVTEDIWFGKMRNPGIFKKNPDSEVVRRATDLVVEQSDNEIMRFVDSMKGLPKVKWKDSIQEVITKQAGTSQP